MMAEVKMEKKQQERGGAEGDSSLTSALLAWFKYYFMEGQNLFHAIDPEALKGKPWYYRYRPLIAFILPPLLIHTCYWAYMIRNDKLGVFTEISKASTIPNWYMSVTMMFGAFIAGSTSEGGAAVAFPVLTLVFHVKAAIARDFSLMCQSFGMTAAACTILLMGVRVDWYSVIYTTLGGFPGIIVGLEYVFPRMPPPYPKMVFVSTWLSFAFALWLVNRLHGRLTFDTVPHWDRGVLFQWGPVAINWKAMTLLCMGFLGGISSAIGGSGIDICSFSCLTLLFRVSEKVATPTSILLMAINTVVGFIYRDRVQDAIHPAAWDFLLVVIPVCALSAPLGAFLSSYFHRLVHATVVYVMDIAQFVGALILIRPWSHHATPNPAKLSGVMAAIIVVGAVVFQSMSVMGERLLLQQTQLPQHVNKSKHEEEDDSATRPSGVELEMREAITNTQ